MMDLLQKTLVCRKKWEYVQNPHPHRFLEFERTDDSFKRTVATVKEHLILNEDLILHQIYCVLNILDTK